MQGCRLLQAALCTAVATDRRLSTGCVVFYWLMSNYIQWYDAFTGIEFNGSFSGSTSPDGSGYAVAYYSDNQCFSGGCEYGLTYNFATGALQMYWSVNTNCGTPGSPMCFTDSGLTSGAPEQRSTCDITGLKCLNRLHIRPLFHEQRRGQLCKLPVEGRRDRDRNHDKLLRREGRMDIRFRNGRFQRAA